jgi:hypothetical protein
MRGLTAFNVSRDLRRQPSLEALDDDGSREVNSILPAQGPGKFMLFSHPLRDLIAANQIIVPPSLKPVIRLFLHCIYMKLYEILFYL